MTSPRTKKPPESINLGLDTQVFRRVMFDFERSQHLTSLREHAKAGRVRILITDIVDREVRTGIRKEVTTALEIFSKKFRQATRILHGKESHRALGHRLELEEVLTEKIGEYERYLRDAHVEILDCSTLQVGQVLADYFAGKAPFGTQDKKAEFPDAFSAMAYGRWCDERNEETVIVSEDGGFREACDAHPRLRTTGQIEEVLASLTELASHATAQIVRAGFLVSALHTRILERIASEFMAANFELDTDEVADVEIWDVETSPDTIVLKDSYLTDLAEGNAIFEWRATIPFKCRVSFSDPESTYYDKEERITHVFNRIDGHVNDVADVAVTVMIRIDDDEPDESHLEFAEVNRGDGIAVSLAAFATTE